MEFSTFQTNARSPSKGLDSSSSLRRRSTESARSSSTIEIVAEAIEGHACDPRCGSPVLDPRPCVSPKEVYPRQDMRVNISITAS